MSGRAREQQFQQHVQQTLHEDAIVLNDGFNPLDETLLREIETELVALTGCSKQNRVRLTVCDVPTWNAVLARHVPPRLHRQGMARHFRVLTDPKDPHHLYVGPSALAGLNEGHTNVISDLLYRMVDCMGGSSNQAFERGVNDLLVAELGRRLKLPVFENLHPREREFVSLIVEAMRGVDEDPTELLGLLKRNPREFFRRLKDSGFYKWWESSVRNSDQMSQYVDLIASTASPSAQLEGSFMAWAMQCADIYCQYRAQQRKNALAGAAKRGES